MRIFVTYFFEIQISNMKLLSTLVFLLTMAITACQGQSSIDALTFKSQLDLSKDPVILDVRTPEEFTDYRIAKAVNMDVYDPEFRQKVATLDKSKSYFVYCHSGARGDDAVEIMKKEGFNKVVNLD